jgi:hypothetical protein
VKYSDSNLTVLQIPGTSIVVVPRDYCTPEGYETAAEVALRARRNVLDVLALAVPADVYVGSGIRRALASYGLLVVQSGKDPHQTGRDYLQEVTVRKDEFLRHLERFFGQSS